MNVMEIISMIHRPLKKSFTQQKHHMCLMEVALRCFWISPLCAILSESCKGWITHNKKNLSPSLVAVPAKLRSENLWADKEEPVFVSSQCWQRAVLLCFPGRHVSLCDLVELHRGRRVHRAGRSPAARGGCVRRGEGVHHPRGHRRLPHRADQCRCMHSWQQLAVSKTP